MTRKKYKRPGVEGVRSPRRRAARPAPPTVTGGDPVFPTGDIAFVVGRDAEGLHIVRRRSEEGPIETGLLRPMREGKPITGEVVTLTPRQDVPMIFDVKTEFSSTAEGSAAPDDGPPRPSVDGPAQVATDAYRKGWDAVWGPRRRDRTLN